MGSDKQVDALTSSDEQPQFTCNLITQPYRISRYPVTVAQYRLFVEDGGYETQEYWTQAGWAWRRSEDISGPRSFGPIEQTPNHPQVGVSWYEAIAYCNWLSERLGEPVRLPTEAQWERAARHVDGRFYPWGDEFGASRCNMSDTGVGSTCTVGIFPEGDAECGAADMSGNVWEWCATKWRPDYSQYEALADDSLDASDSRVLRGGAFFNARLGVRCACRNLRRPDYGVRLLRFSGVCPRPLIRCAMQISGL